jgi:hypothetical protein
LVELAQLVLEPIVAAHQASEPAQHLIKPSELLGTLDRDELGDRMPMNCDP